MTCQKIRLDEWKGLALALRQDDAAGEQMGEDSISRTLGVALAPHPYLVARHAVNDGGRNAAAAAASASAQVARWE